MKQRSMRFYVVGNEVPRRVRCDHAELRVHADLRTVDHQGPRRHRDHGEVEPVPPESIVPSAMSRKYPMFFYIAGLEIPPVMVQNHYQPTSYHPDRPGVRPVDLNPPAPIVR